MENNNTDTLGENIIMNKLYNDLNEHNKKIENNNNILIKLKEHQKTSINAMLEFEESGKVVFSKKAYIDNFHVHHEEDGYYYRYHRNDKEFGDIEFEIESNYGILADKVGSGKTFMILGLIAERLVPNARDRILSSSIYTTMRYKNNKEAMKTNLIIVPHNLISQWKTAFKYAKYPSYSVIKKADIGELIFSENMFKNQKPAEDAEFSELNCVEFYDAIIVSATMFEEFYEKFRSVKWARIIIDEVCSIKLPQDLDYNCNFIWFITATPSGIKYVRRQYIRTLVSHVTENIIKYIAIKNNDDYVDKSMNLPNINQIIINCLSPRELNIIRDYVDDEIINMINAGNDQEAIAKLNCNVDSSDNILDVVTKQIKKDLNNKRKEHAYQSCIEVNDKKHHEEKLKNIEEKIKSLEIKLKTIEDRIKTFKEESCPICLGELEKPVMTPCCNQLFCLECIVRGGNNCPMCREKIDYKKMNVIDDNSKKPKKDENVKEHVLRKKIDNLITILTQKKGKFLLFSNYDQTFDNIQTKLLENNITIGKLQGTPSMINNTIKKFDEGHINVLMLNASNYGSGLNLQMATDIIIYHELNKELETQVIGRAQRLGRTTILNVYYLLNEGEQVNCNNPTLSLDIFEDNVSDIMKNHIKKLEGNNLYKNNIDNIDLDICDSDNINHLSEHSEDFDEYGRYFRNIEHRKLAQEQILNTKNVTKKTSKIKPNYNDGEEVVVKKRIARKKKE